MIKKITKFHVITLTLVTFLCVKVYAEPTNLGKLKKQVIQYHDSGTYQKDIEAVAANATSYIDEQVKINAHSNNPKKLALVLDIDETCLSNYTHMLSHDFSESDTQIEQSYLAADAPAIQPMLALYQSALQQNVAIFFITGRNKSFKKTTILNLRKAGYAHWAGIELNTRPQPVATYKSAARSAIEKKGYTIIASIGDQYSDLVGGYAQKTFKLPNPYYYIPSGHYKSI
jgi:acid phosphatase